MAAPVFVVAHLLACLALAATAFVAGRTLLPEARFPDPVERAAVALPLGLAVLAHVALLLGFCGQLRALPLGLALGALHLAGWRAWRELAAAARTGLRRLAALPPRTALLGSLAAILGAAPFALLPLYPPPAFDATLYHLPFARIFAATGGVPFLPQLRMPVFPQLNELLFAGALVVGDDLLAQGAMAVATLATAALLVVWGRRGFAPGAGLLAAALFLGCPIVAYLAGTAYIDPGLTLLATAALYCAARFRGTGGGGWLALTAVFAAAAADGKYLGLFFVGILALAVASAPRSTPRRRLRSLVLYGLVAVAVLAPWYGRIVAWTGNPLFPFAPRIFGASLWTNDLGSPPLSYDEAILPLTELPAAAWRWVRALLPLPGLGPRPLGSRPFLSPFLLLGLPLVVATAFREARVRRALLLVAVYAAAVCCLPPDVRYLVPVVPLLGLAVGESVARRTAAGHHRLLVPLLAVLCLAPGWAYAAYRIHRQGPLPVDPASRLRYLERQTPVAAAVHFLNRTAGPRYTVYALHAENLVYYADGTLLGDWIGPASFWKVGRVLGDPAALHRTLHGFGATYLLIPRSVEAGVPLSDPAFSRLFRPVYEDAEARVFALAP